MLCILSPLLLIIMNCLVWNCKGAGKRNFPGLIRNCVRMYKLCFLAILEPRISGRCAEKVIDRLGFDGAARVEAIGFSGGI